jgi:iron(III) transport system substrate-binding protein
VDVQVPALKKKLGREKIMKKQKHLISGAALISAFFVSAMPLSLAAELPETTTAMLSDLKLEASLLSDIDTELAVPPDWLAEAKKEGGFRITGSWQSSRFTSMTASFRARYPFIKISYSRGSFQTRVLKPLVAMKEGRYTVDAISSIGGALAHYYAADLLDDLRVLPGARNVPDGMKDAKGRWIGMRIRHWCMSYNTDRVQKSDMPKTWDEILTNPRWRHGNIAVNNLSQVWLLPLWGENGEAWGTNFMEKLFKEVRPQLRKEGANALVDLVVAGEFDAAIPAGDHRVGEAVDKGAPIGWHCPQPVPSAIGEIAVIKGSPNIDAARIFANWLLSKEGQIAQFRWEQAVPIHKDLQLPVFQKFPEETLGKKIAFRDPSLTDEENTALLKVWNPLWEQPR